MKHYEKEQRAALHKAFLELIDSPAGYSAGPARILEIATKHDVSPCELEGKLFDAIEAEEAEAQNESFGSSDYEARFY